VKVLHLVKTAQGAMWALRQVEVLCRHGVEVVVALPSITKGLAPRYRRAGAEVVCADIDFTMSRPWRLAPAVQRCRALVARVAPDVIHSHFVSTTLVARLALGRRHPVPRIFQVPGPLHLEHGFFRRLDLRTAGPRDVWIGSCAWTQQEYLRRGVPAERVFLSYYGTDVTALAGLAGRFRPEIGVPPKAPLVGMVAYAYRPKWYAGRRGIKGHEDFIEAVRELRGTIREARAVVVGGAWQGAERYERSLRARASASCGTALRFTGVRQDVPAVYADLDVAVQPSRSEGLPNATVEALASGCPVVATAVGGLPDVVRDGATGWLVPAADPVALANGILEALADRAEAARRAAAGRDLVTKLVTIERTAAEIAALYERLAGAASTAGIAAVAALSSPLAPAAEASAR